MTRLSFVFTGLLLAATIDAASSLAAVSLRYRFSPGAELRYALTIDNRTEIRNPAASKDPVATVMATRADLVQKVKAESGGVATLDTRIERPHVTIQGSQSAIKNEFAKLLARAKFNVRVDTRGKVHGIDEPRGLPVEVRRFVASMGQAIAQFQPVFPESPVATGATWTNTVEAPHTLATGDAITTKLAATWTYNGPKEEKGRRGESVSVNLVVTMGGSVKQAGRVFAVDIKGSGRGELLWDNERGALVESEITVTMDGAWRGEKMTVEQSSKVTTRAVRQ